MKLDELEAWIKNWALRNGSNIDAYGTVWEWRLIKSLADASRPIHVFTAKVGDDGVADEPPVRALYDKATHMLLNGLSIFHLEDEVESAELIMVSILDLAHFGFTMSTTQRYVIERAANHR